MNLTPRTVIGLTGLSRAGKDEVANFLRDGYGFIKISFADALKEGAAAMLGVDIEGFYEGDRSGMIPGYPWTYREFLQKLGTEAMRTVFGDDFWVRVASQQIALEVAENPHARFVIPDVRFNNEAQWVRAFGLGVGELWHIERPGLTKMAHASEQGVDFWFDRDARIKNTGTLNDLKARVALQIGRFLDAGVPD